MGEPGCSINFGTLVLFPCVSGLTLWCGRLALYSCVRVLRYQFWAKVFACAGKVWSPFFGLTSTPGCDVLCRHAGCMDLGPRSCGLDLDGEKQYSFRLF